MDFMLEPLVGSQLLVGMATITTHVAPEVSSTRVKRGAAVIADAGTIIKTSEIQMYKPVPFFRALLHKLPIEIKIGRRVGELQ